MATRKPVIHGRDHLPGGADPIPDLSSGGAECCYAQLYQYTAIPVGSGSSQVFVADEFNTNSLQASVSASPTGVFSTGATSTVDNAVGDRYLHVHKPGMVLVFPKAVWAKTTAPFHQEMIPVGNARMITMSEFTPDSYGSSLAAAYIATEYASQWLIGAADLVASPYFKTISFNMKQTSGGTVNLLDTLMVALWIPMTSDFEDDDLVYQN